MFEINDNIIKIIIKTKNLLILIVSGFVGTIITIKTFEKPK